MDWSTCFRLPRGVRLSSLRRVIATAFSPPVVRAAIRIPLLVGSVLNAINLGERLAGAWTFVLIARAVANYLIAHSVATYGAVATMSRPLPD